MMMNLPCLRESCSNFLHSIYHILNTSQGTKREHTPCWKLISAATLVFLFNRYWSPSTCHDTDLPSTRTTTTAFCWSFADAVHWNSIIYGFLFPCYVRYPMWRLMLLVLEVFFLVNSIYFLMYTGILIHFLYNFFSNSEKLPKKLSVTLNIDQFF